MSYATQQDMTERFGEAELIALTDRADPPAGAIDAAVLARALADAGQTIDGYLAGRYSLPLAEAPASLTAIQCDIARYRLYDDAAPDQVATRHGEAVARLKDIAAGRFVLQAAGGAPSADGPSVLTVGPERIHTHDSLKGLCRWPARS